MRIASNAPCDGCADYSFPMRDIENQTRLWPKLPIRNPDLLQTATTPVKQLGASLRIRRRSVRQLRSEVLDKCDAIIAALATFHSFQLNAS